MKRTKGPRTPLGKARKTIKEQEAIISGLNAALDDMKRKAQKDNLIAERFVADFKIIPEGGREGNPTPREMAHMLVDMLPERSPDMVAVLAVLRAQIHVWRKKQELRKRLQSNPYGRRYPV